MEYRQPSTSSSSWKETLGNCVLEAKQAKIEPIVSFTTISATQPGRPHTETLPLLGFFTQNPLVTSGPTSSQLSVGKLSSLLCFAFDTRKAQDLLGNVSPRDGDRFGQVSWMFPNSHQVFQLSGKLFVLTAPETLLPHSHLPIWAPKSIDWEYERQDFWKKLYNQIESHQSQHQQHQQLTTQDSAIEMHTSTQNDHTSTSSGDNTSTSSAAPEYFGVIMVDVDKVEQVDHSLWPHRQMLHSTVMPERTFGRICSNRWVAKDVTAATNSLTTSLLLAKKKVTQ